MNCILTRDVSDYPPHVVHVCSVIRKPQVKEGFILLIPFECEPT